MQINKKQLIIIVIVMVFFCHIAFAQASEHPIDKKLKESIEKSITPDQRNSCFDEACKGWDLEINKYYNLLLGVLGKEEKDQLAQAQAAWLKFRDSETKFRMDAFLKTKDVMRNNMAVEEKLYIRKQRALELEGLYYVFSEAKE